MTTMVNDRVERELQIAAPPDTVFGFLTDPARIVQWMGRSATLEPVPGGLFRVDYNGFDIARGRFVEVTPYSRVVFTWGWESLAADALRPGESTVEITLVPDGAGTRLRLVHSGLSEVAAASHAEGWDIFLPVLQSRAAGGPAAPAAPPLSAGEERASRLNSLLVECVEAIEAVPAARWTAPVPGDGRAVNVVADHIVRHLALVGFAGAVVAGESAPQASMTLDMLDGMNAEHARGAAGVSREQVIARLREQGPAAVSELKQLTVEGLARSAPMTFAGGAEVPAGALVEGPLLADIHGHLDGIKAAAS